MYFSYGSHGLKDAQKYAVLSNKHFITNKDKKLIENNESSIIKALIKENSKVIDLSSLVNKKENY